MEPRLRIKLARDNLSLAISLWAAAQRQKISYRSLSGRLRVNTNSGEPVEVNSRLEVRSDNDLLRLAANQIRGAFALSAIEADRVLESVCVRPPLLEENPDLSAARCILRLLARAVNQDLLTPVWECPPGYRRRFEVRHLPLTLDAAGVDGQPVSWDALGGLEQYIALLDYCGDRINQFSQTPLPAPAPAEGNPPHDWELDLPEGPGVETPPIARIEPLSLEARQPETEAAAASYTAQVAQFVTACCDTGAHSKVLAKNLYDAYLGWCQQNGYEALAQRSFGMSLTEMGFERRRRGRGRHWWEGIALIAPASSGGDDADPASN